jgi:hypothetical protein
MATAAALITTAVVHPRTRSQSGFVRFGPMTVGWLVSGRIAGLKYMAPSSDILAREIHVR